MEKINVSQVREWDDKDGNHHIERVDSKGLTKTVVKNKNKGMEKKGWKERLRGLRIEGYIEGYSWDNIDDVDSFQRGQLEDFIQQELDKAREEGEMNILDGRVRKVFRGGCRYTVDVKKEKFKSKLKQ